VESGCGGPSAREFSAVAYGAGKIVVFGGRNGTTEFNDTWLWDGAQWAQVAVNDPNAPTPRFGAAMAYDENTQMFVLFGGTRGSLAVPGRTYRFDANTRQWFDVAGGGPVRFHHAMTYYPPLSTVVMFGGLKNATTQVTPDLLAWDGANWNIVPITSGAALARSNHTLGYEPAQGLVLYGGETASGALDDAYVVKNNAWMPLNTGWTGTARSAHAMVFDVNQGGFLIYAGKSGAAFLSTAFLSSGATTSLLGSVGIQPSARAGHAAVYDQARKRGVVVGGASTGGVVADSTWEFMMTGQPCTSANDCATGVCATGVCCATACDPPCHDCDRLNTKLDPVAVDGECRIVTGKDPRFCMFDPGCEGKCSEIGTCLYPGRTTACGLCLACNDQNGKCDQMPMSEDDPKCDTLANKPFHSCDPANVSCRTYDMPKTLHRCLAVGQCGWRWSDCRDYLSNSCGACK
jgi:hypothetical protein